MKNTSIDIADKLSKGLVRLYRDIDDYTGELGIDYLVVGAMARDLVLVHGYGSTIQRGTRDVDFGINVSSWKGFNALRDRLLKGGYQADAKRWHRLGREDEEGVPWEIDIIPFGEITDEKAILSWPPKQEIVMNVLGFAEAAEHALRVHIDSDPDISIPVASPAGISILKLVAWLDRDVELRGKDARDFLYAVQSYTKIPEVYDAVYEEGYMEAQKWDEAMASASKLGGDAGAIALPPTKTFLVNELIVKPKEKERFARDMAGDSNSLGECIELLEVFLKEFDRDPAA